MTDQPNPVGAGLTNGDYRRVTALTCAVATADPAGINAIIAEAETAHRTWHLIVAQALSLSLGMRADTPEGLDSLRQVVAGLTALEDKENEK